MHPTLSRLDDLAVCLGTDSTVLAVLGLGSAGQQTNRFDEHSDIDFFVVVSDHAAKQRYIESTEWLSGFGGQVIYDHINDPNGRKALFADGLFLEYAIFTASELEDIAFQDARIVWSQPAFVLRETAARPVTAIDTVDFHLNEALTNLYVGMHRELRGERLTATRFIQVHAVDRILALERHHPTTIWTQPDPFEATRRIEHLVSDRQLPLAQMMPGYGHNASAAVASLNWLRQCHDPTPAITSAIQALIQQVPQV